MHVGLRTQSGAGAHQDALGQGVGGLREVQTPGEDREGTQMERLALPGPRGPCRGRKVGGLSFMKAGQPRD